MITITKPAIALLEANSAADNTQESGIFVSVSPEGYWDLYSPNLISIVGFHTHPDVLIPDVQADTRMFACTMKEILNDCKKAKSIGFSYDASTSAQFTLCDKGLEILIETSATKLQFEFSDSPYAWRNEARAMCKEKDLAPLFQRVKIPANAVKVLAKLAALSDGYFTHQVIDFGSQQALMFTTKVSAELTAYYVTAVKV